MEKDITTKVDPFNSSHFGQDTFFISNFTSEKNFLILSTETFAKNEDYIFTKIFEFLNLPKYEIKNLKQMSKTTYHNTLNPKTKIKLDKFFESSNKELFKLIEQEFTWS